ncbi:hypothetical protein CSC67_07895 [Pusillimonas caeni]|uniref:ATPase, T2SS/T4P/T4SS family n=1 Tax=Pusillimonas caeni TaxID=1348472 RepID=UPI000E59ADD0|nr:ATPase, T2SS/T4P/T4SS family [Pusillimonas caeni]TFL14079.1 hypothetical protein CSC67_07895 [Pusillimonas caeni]
MNMGRLSQREFVDIVLGPDFCDIKVEGPEQTCLYDVETDCPADVQRLRAMCRDASAADAEFTLVHEGMRFRVTAMQQDVGPVWFLSRIDAQVRPIQKLPVPGQFVAFCLRPKLHGLILITGGFGTGKTTTASSLFAHRVSERGGTGVAMEDPTAEVQMAGRAGSGRIVSIPISRRLGGYQAALQLVRRSRADLILVGEIRNADTAVEALDVANTDMPVLVTMHASSVPEALDKYHSYLRARGASGTEASSRLAMSIAGIVHLTKTYVTDSSDRHIPRFSSDCLVLDRDDQSCLGAIGKIREGNFAALQDDIQMQKARYWRSTLSSR